MALGRCGAQIGLLSCPKAGQRWQWVFEIGRQIFRPRAIGLSAIGAWAEPLPVMHINVPDLSMFQRNIVCPFLTTLQYASTSFPPSRRVRFAPRADIRQRRSRLTLT